MFNFGMNTTRFSIVRDMYCEHTLLAHTYRARTPQRVRRAYLGLAIDRAEIVCFTPYHFRTYTGRQCAKSSTTWVSLTQFKAHMVCQINSRASQKST
jgi:hypothetical protein